MDKKEELEEMLLFALPYIEDAADDPCYKDRGVKKCKEWVKRAKEILK